VKKGETFVALARNILRKTLKTWGTPWELYENGLGTKNTKKFH
jgi:hypothetical protein